MPFAKNSEWKAANRPLKSMTPHSPSTTSTARSSAGPMRSMKASAANCLRKPSTSAMMSAATPIMPR